MAISIVVDISSLFSRVSHVTLQTVVYGGSLELDTLLNVLLIAPIPILQKLECAQHTYMYDTSILLHQCTVCMGQNRRAMHTPVFTD